MPTNQQRRAAERRRLQQQLEQRRAREQSRKRFTLIASIVGTLVVIAAIVVIVVATTSGGSDKNPTASKPSGTTSGSASLTPSSSPTSSGPPVPVPSADRKVTFDGVTVTSGSTLSTQPKVTSTSSTTPSKIEVKDVVAGKGAAVSPSSTVTVQYTGVLYKNGTEFDSSWSRGQAAQFSLAQTVPGFTEGIGGGGGITPMKVGGRRIIIVPAADGYGSQAQAKIPANSTLVFVVDLTAAG